MFRLFALTRLCLNWPRQAGSDRGLLGCFSAMQPPPHRVQWLPERSCPPPGAPPEEKLLPHPAPKGVALSGCHPFSGLCPPHRAPQCTLVPHSREGAGLARVQCHSPLPPLQIHRARRLQQTAQCFSVTSPSNKPSQPTASHQHPLVLASVRTPAHRPDGTRKCLTPPPATSTHH